MSSPATSSSCASTSLSTESSAASASSPEPPRRWRASPTSARAPRLPRIVHCVHRVPAGDRGPRGPGRLAQVVRGGQPSCLLGQIPVLARLRVDRLDLGEAVPQQVSLLRQPTRAVAPLDELGCYRLPLGTHGPVPLQWRAHGVAGEPVEQRPLLGGPQQPQLVVLPVHRECGVGQPGQHTDGHRAPAQVRPRAPVRADGPHGDQRTVVVRLSADVVRHRQRRLVRREPTLHHGPPRPVRHPGRLGAPAAEQREAGDDHGLARARLTGEHGEAGVELQGGVVDHAEALDPHLGEHEGSLRAGTDGPRRTVTPPVDHRLAPQRR